MKAYLLYGGVIKLYILCYIISVWAHWNGVLYMECQIYETAWYHIWIFSGHNYFCNFNRCSPLCDCLCVQIWYQSLYNSMNTAHLHIYILKIEKKIMYGTRDLFFFSPPMKICIMDLCNITRKNTAYLCCLNIDGRYVTVNIALVAYIK